MNMNVSDPIDNPIPWNNINISTDITTDSPMTWLSIKIFIYSAYTIIFLLGLSGNLLVLFIVFRNKSMQTITNIFITNLALSDILTTLLSVPFTPIAFYLNKWTLPTFLCSLLPYAMGISIYVSTLTSTAIAIDRYIVIVHPFVPRMKMSICIIVIVTIWLIAGLISLPNAIYVFYNSTSQLCIEQWPSIEFNFLVTSGNFFLQFVVPVIIISCCYYQVIRVLNKRGKRKIGSGTKNRQREQAEIQRKKRTTTMLIIMVVVFLICWTPFNLFWIISDRTNWLTEYLYQLLFIISHIIAMSSNIYNPLLYGWFNRNFRLEFQRVLPCLKAINFKNNNNSNQNQGDNKIINDDNTHFKRYSSIQINEDDSMEPSDKNIGADNISVDDNVKMKKFEPLLTVPTNNSFNGRYKVSCL